MNVKQALEQLDPGNVEHWTSDGVPRVDVVQASVQANPPVTRAQIIEASPLLTRVTAIGPGADNTPAVTMTDPPAEPEAPEITHDDPPDDTTSDDPVGSDKPDDTTDSEPDMPAQLSDAELEQKRAMELRELDGQVGDLQAEAAKLQRQILAISNQRNRLQETIRRSTDQASDLRAIQRMLKSSHTESMARAARVRKILDAGITAKDFDPRSPLDRAMAQRKRAPVPLPQPRA